MENAVSKIKKRLNLSARSLNPFPKRQILDSSNMKEFADNNFELCEIGRR